MHYKKNIILQIFQRKIVKKILNTVHKIQQKMIIFHKIKVKIIMSLVFIFDWDDTFFFTSHLRHLKSTKSKIQIETHIL